MAICQETTRSLFQCYFHNPVIYVCSTRRHPLVLSLLYLCFWFCPQWKYKSAIVVGYTVSYLADLLTENSLNLRFIRNFTRTIYFDLNIYKITRIVSNDINIWSCKSERWLFQNFYHKWEQRFSSLLICMPSCRFLVVVGH